MRLALFVAELGQREQAFRAEQLATALAGLIPARSAIDYVVRGSRVRIATNTAAAIAASWAAQGQNAAAAAVLNAMGGITALTESRVSGSGESDGVADWAIATFHVSGLESVLTHLERHLPLPDARDPREDPKNADQARDWRVERKHEERRHQRLEVLTACFDELLEIRDFTNLDAIGDRIDVEGNVSWQARGRLMRARAAAADGDAEETVAQIRLMFRLDAPSSSEDQDDGTRVPHGFRLQGAMTLLSLGLSDSETFRALIGDDERPTINDDPGHEPESSYRQLPDFETVRHYLALARRSSPLKRSSPPASDASKTAGTGADGGRHHDAARQRFVDAVLALARLRAEAIAAREGLVATPAVAGRAIEVLQVVEVPRQTTSDWHGWYRVREAFPSLMAHLIHLAHRVGGSAELSRLARVFDLAWSGQRASYWSVEFRQAALEQFATLDQSSDDWIKRKLDDIESLIIERSYDPQSQVEAWLKQAKIRSSVDQRTKALDAVVAAVDASLGLGMTDDDEQLAHWTGWLAAAKDCGAISDSDYLAAIDRFAARLPGASRADESASAAAAARLVRECWRVSPVHAYRVGIALCEVGALPEADLIAAALLGSLDAEDASAVRLTMLVAIEMLLPITGRDRDRVIERLRAVVSVVDRDTIDQSMQVWGLVEETEESRTTSPSDQADNSPDDSTDRASPREVATAAEAETPATAAGLLAALRRLPDNYQGSDSWWTAMADAALGGPLPVNVARALVQELGRLRSTEHTLGLACGSLAEAGDPETARQHLQVRSSTLPSGGWFRRYDGGSRRSLFAGALRGGAPAVVQLALSDLAETLAGGILASTRLAEVREILELVAGPTAVGAALSDVEAYLDIIAPADPSFRAGSLGPRLDAIADTSAAALAGMVGDYLGHPAKAPEEGARRALVRLLTSESPGAAARTAILAALEDAVGRGGWPAESALSVLLLAAPDQPSASLIEAVERTTGGDDQILRDLGGRVCVRWGRQPVSPPTRHLSPIYRMSLPPLPTRRPPEVDAEGINFVDRSDPQQVVAPFCTLLGRLAEPAGTTRSAVLHRASQLALAGTGDSWTDDGHRAMAARLKRRGQAHTFRPWAYMVGRRAAGRVLAEMIDAGVLSVLHPAFALGLLAPDLLMFEPGPLPDSLPRPWRPESASMYDNRGWCDETQDALGHYMDSLVSDPYCVLAELSDWASLEWERPREERELVPIHLRGHDSFGLPVRAPSAESSGSAAWYLDPGGSDWHQDELIVRGFESVSNAPFLEWVAFHPVAARALGWDPIEGQLFAWRGPDGAWRARSEYSVHGLLSHSPPAHNYVAEVWRVILSQRGLKETERRFGPLVRRLTVTRSVPARRDGASEQRVTRVGWPDLSD